MMLASENLLPIYNVPYEDGGEPPSSTVLVLVEKILLQFYGEGR